MVDTVVGEVPIGAGGGDWKASLRSTILGARGVLLRHRWAPAIVETRADPGPAVLRWGGLGPCDDDVELRFALDLIIDGLERLRGVYATSWLSAASFT